MMPVSVSAASPLALTPDGWPLVKPRSALLDFLTLCRAGACVKSEVLQADVQKREDGLWTGYGGQALSSLQLLLGFRSELLLHDESLKEADLDKMHISIDPDDKVRIKREVAAGGEAQDSASEEEDAVHPRTLAVIDISGNGDGVETETSDGGASSSPVSAFCHTSPYGPHPQSLGPAPPQGSLRVWCTALGGSWLAARSFTGWVGWVVVELSGFPATASCAQAVPPIPVCDVLYLTTQAGLVTIGCRCTCACRAARLHRMLRPTLRRTC